MGAKLRGLWRAFAVRICSHVHPAVHGRSSRSVAPSWRWLDIRASLQRGSAALPPSPSLSLPQTCALLGWNKVRPPRCGVCLAGYACRPFASAACCQPGPLAYRFLSCFFDIAAEGEDCASAASAQKLQVLVMPPCGPRVVVGASGG